MRTSKRYIARAFVSCSIRDEDRQFVNFVSNILHHYRVFPFGTVGIYAASPENPSELIRRNIELSDFVVIAATKRYFTEEIQSGCISNAISEMIQVEAGIAFANAKPVVVFVKEGTNVGTFLPSITQYITLDGTQDNLDSQSNLIMSLLRSASRHALVVKDRQDWRELRDILIGGLAIYGGLKLLEELE